MIAHISEVDNGFLLVTERPGAAPGSPTMTTSYVFLTLSDLVGRISVIYGGIESVRSADAQRKSSLITVAGSNKKKGG